MSDTHQGHHTNYFLIFIALCICTALSVIFDLAKDSMGSKVLLLTLIFSVAIAKALFVLVYFMHLKFEGRWKYLLLAPTVVLAMGLPLALLPDVGMHYYTPVVPQIEIRQQQLANAAETAGEQPHGEPEAESHGEGH